MTTSTKIKACRFCKSTNLLETLDLGRQALTGVFPKSKSEPIGTGPLTLLWCGDCTLLQLAHSCDPSEMYGDNYGYRSGLNKSMIEHLQRKTHGLETIADLKPGDTVLDIGSNDGTLLASYRTPGIRLVGIDPTAEKFRRYYPAGAIVVPNFFSAAAFHNAAGAKAKIITSVSMFYDLEDPLAFVEQVAESLAPDGLWHFEQSYMPSMLRTTSYDTVCHEHLEYYSLGVVKRMLDRAGFEIADVGFNRINGGSFAVTACKASAKHRRRPELVQWLLRQEERIGLHTPKPHREFESRVYQHREDFRELLRTLRRGGATIMGQGASTKGNVLLQFCGIGPDEIQAIGEVNPDKFGCVTPGSNIPIVPEAEVRAAKPDYVVVLPWHFRDGIIEREADFLRSGGRLIFPLPEIEVFCY
jgi:SAM-dependent methyltransferase